MIEKKVKPKLPESVDEAAELLLSDLLMQHLQTLSNLDAAEFDNLCDKVAPFLLEEFKLWQGNEKLLDSCYSDMKSEETDPARIILQRVKQLLYDFHGFVVIT